MTHKKLYCEETEDTIINAIVNDKDLMLLSLPELRDCFFYSSKAKTVFSVIKQLERQKINVDFISILAEIQKNEIMFNVFGAIPYNVVQYLAKSVYSFTVSNAIKYIKELYIKREILNLSMLITQKTVESAEIEDLMTDVQKFSNIFSLSGESNEPVTMPEHIMEFDKNLSKKIEKLKKNCYGVKITGITTGFKELNIYTSGWQPEQFIILAARPSIGKTSIVLHFINSAAIEGLNCAFFSLEMSNIQIVTKLLAMQNDINPTKLKHATLNENDFRLYSDACDELQSKNIFLDTKPGSTLSYISNKSKLWKAKYGIDMIVIDYLQLMTPETNGTQNDKVGEISKGLKKLAKELKIPVIALSQLSRAVDSRDNQSKLPQLSDLRDSGNIEQDADIVIFLRRLERYGVEVDEDDNPTQNIVDVIVAKNREGECGKIRVMHNGQMARFFDILEYENNQEETPF